MRFNFVAERKVSFRKIFFLGAGAIGSSYGALLSERNNATLIGRKAHVDAIHKNGLILSGSIRRQFFLKAESIIRRIPSDTLIVLTTKAYDSEDAVKSIRHLLRDDTVLLVLQNGLGIRDSLEGIVENKATVIRGLSTSAAECFDPGKISFWHGETMLEPSRTSERIAEIFNKSGLRTFIPGDMQKEIWKKLITNCLVNPLTAILRVRNRDIMVDTLEETRHGIIQECMAVGRSEGIDLESDLVTKIEQKLSTYTNYSSMCQDIMRGKKTEIDFINGKIVQLGKKHNISTPLNGLLVSIIRFMEGRPR